MPSRLTALLKTFGSRREFENLDGVLPDYAWVSLGQLLAEYRAVSITPTSTDEARTEHEEDLESQIVKEIEEKRDNRRATWNDMYLLELVVLRRLPVEEIRQKLSSMRSQYRQMVGKATFNEYTANLPDVAIDANVSGIAERMTFDLYRLYALTLKRDAVRRYLSRLVLITTSVVAIPVIVGMIYIHVKGLVIEGRIPTTVVVLLAGIMGGLISLQRRLQSTSEETDPLISLFGLANAGAEVMLAPVSGAVFALLLYVLFISGLVQGALFPSIYTPDSYEGWKSITFGVMSYYVGPKTGTDFGKLLVWCFIAGFAERFIPDTLDRLLQKSQAAEQQTTPTT